jgi:hypothetical protein
VHDRSLPSDFCELGVKRFQRDLLRFHYIKDEIVESLQNKIINKGDKELVLPPSLFGLTE